MAILADFFVASPEQAMRYYNRADEADGGSEIAALLQPVSYTGFTSVQIGMLWAILDGIAWNVKQHELETIAFSDEGTWLQRFPAVFTQLLADPSADQVASASVKWASTEEIDCSPDELMPVLKDLQALAKRAVGTNPSVYLWGSV